MIGARPHDAVKRAPSVATSIVTHPEAHVEKPPIPSLPPKATWRHDGDLRITEFCGNCNCRVVFDDFGRCVWCDGKVR